MAEYEEPPETGTFQVVDVFGRGILFDSRTGWSWMLFGVEDGKPHWKPIRWADKSEKKPPIHE